MVGATSDPRRASRFDRVDFQTLHAWSIRARRHLTGANPRVWAVGATVFTSLLVFLMNAAQGAILARALGPHKRGEYALVVFYAQCLTSVGMLGTLQVTARRARQATSLGELRSLRIAAVQSSVLTGLVSACAAIAMFLVTIPGEKRYVLSWACVASLSLPFEHARQLLLNIESGRGQFGRFNWHRLLFAALYPALLMAAWLRGWVSLSMLSALFLVPFVVSAVALFPLNGESKPNGHPAIAVGTLLREGLPFALPLVTESLLPQLSIALMLWLTDFNQQGFYATAVPAAMVLTVAPSALATFAFRLGAGPGSRDRNRRFTYLFLLATAAQILGLIFMGQVGKRLVLLVYGRRFLTTWPYVVALLPGAAATGLTLVAEAFLRGLGKPGIGGVARVAAAALTAALAILLNSRWPGIAVAAATSAGSTLVLVFMLWAILRQILRNPEAVSLPNSR